MDERKRIERQVQDEYDRKRRELETKRMIEQAENRIRSQMDQADDQRRRRERAIRLQCDRAAAEMAARDKIVSEARRQAALERQSK